MADKDTGGAAPSAADKADDPLIVAQARIAKVVSDWRDGNLRNNAFSRDTDAWNTLEASLPALVEMIVQEISQ